MNICKRQCWWIAFVTIACLSGCGGPATAPAASAPPPEHAVAVATGESATIPDTFPKDVPLYKDLALDSVNSLPGQQTFVIIGHANDPLEKVADTLRKEAADQGWTQAASGDTQTIPDMALLNFTKEKRMLNMTLFRDNTGTSINLTTGPE